MGSRFARILSVFMVLAILSQSSVCPSWAAYDRIVSWSDMSDLDLSSVLNSHYASDSNLYYPTINEGALEIAIQDSDHRIGADFQIPKSIRPVVEFWLRIYTVYGSEEVVIFDARHPTMVYDVLDFRDLAKGAKNNMIYELTREKRISSAVTRYRAAFDRLAHKGRHYIARTDEEKKILAAIVTSGVHYTFEDLKRNLHYQTGQRDNVIKGLLAAENYFPRMEKVFASLDLPPELTRLSMVESSFDLRAYSRVGAVGVWQFMPGPGRKFLTVSDNVGVDERLSPLKSTLAAGKLLRESYRRFRNWPLAITSYNHGLKGLIKYSGGVAGTGLKSISFLFDPNQSRGSSPLGWAARNYYPEFLAMVHAEAYRKQFYGEIPAVSLKPVIYQRLEKRTSVLSFAKERGLSLQVLSRANPDILNVVGPLPKNFLLALPGQPGTEDDLSGLTTPFNSRRKALAASRVARRNTHKS